MGEEMIRNKGEKIINKLEAAGYEAYFVGGCVRDSLLGKPPKDWDISTSGRPDEIKTVFADTTVIETGIAHGTVTILMESEPFEVTTYRIDGKYQDNRRPDTVTFTASIEEDLARRDFTINAMAYHSKRGLIDCFGGIKDLEAGLIRCVGVPQCRFMEDGLRIMRAVRFASQLGFQIEEETYQAMKKEKALIDNISAERLREEFLKILQGADAAKAIEENREIIFQLIPQARAMYNLDQQNPYHVYDVWQHTLHVTTQVENTPILRLAGFFHDIGKPSVMTVDEQGHGHFYKHEQASKEIATQALARLKCDNKTKQLVIDLVANHGIVFQPTEKQAKRLLGKLGADTLHLLTCLECSDVKSQNPVYTKKRLENIQDFRKVVDKVIENKQCFQVKDLKIDGKILMEAGVKEGRAIGEIKNALLDLVVEDQLENKEEVLLAKALELYSIISFTGK